MKTSYGRFIWYELVTPDPDAAAQFYGAILGWRIAANGMPSPEGIDYRHIIRSDGGSQGGVLRLTEDMRASGAHPCWLPYLHVADVDTETAAIVAEGGKVLMPKMTIDVGSFALLADPQGIPIYIMTPVPPADRPDAVSDVFSVSEPQHVRWNELASPDQKASMDFYARHFGFAYPNSMPMGDMGDYCFIDHNGICLGAIMQQPHAETPALWQFYFGVPSLMAARKALLAAGGTIVMDAHEVPGGDWIIVATDPRGVPFGLVGPKGE